MVSHGSARTPDTFTAEEMTLQDEGFLTFALLRNGAVTG